MKNFLKTLLAAFIGTLVALLICFSLLFSAIGSLYQPEVTVTPKSSILKLDFEQPVTEQSKEDIFNFNSFNQKYFGTIGIYKVLKSIEIAANDPDVNMIYLNPTNMRIGISHLEEIRDALLKFKDSGKPIIAYCNNYSQADYYLCSVADKVYMNKDGVGEIVGLSANLLFFKNIIDKIGLNVQLVKHGKFKSAAEQFVNNTISPENRLQNQEMINSLWSVISGAVCKSRGIDPQQFNNWVNNLELNLPNTFVEKGLVDSLVTAGQMDKILCNLSGMDADKKLEFLQLNKYASSKIKADIKVKDKIAVIYADGEITMDSEEGISASKYYPIIRDVAKDSSIKAVVLRVNSPGGDAQAAEIINSELQELRKDKPLVISFANYAASGGYWISAQSDYIFTDATSITGSIGVFSLLITYGDLLKKNFDINSVSINTNTHSDMLSGTRPLNTPEIDMIKLFVEDIYDKFLNIVSTGRNINVSQVDSIGQGRVWTGEQAIKINLANEIGGLEDAINYAKMLAGLSNVRIAEYPAPENPFEKLMNMLSESTSNVKILTDPEALVQKTYSYLTKERNNFKTLARLEYLYDIK